MSSIRTPRPATKGEVMDKEVVFETLVITILMICAFFFGSMTKEYDFERGHCKIIDERAWCR